MHKTGNLKSIKLTIEIEIQPIKITIFETKTTD